MKKYIVFKATGGLNHMLIQLNNCINLAKATKRHLIIDTINDLCFKNDFNKYFFIPDFDYSTNYDILKNDENINYNSEEKYLNSICMCLIKTSFVLEDKPVSLSKEEIINSNEQIIYVAWVDNYINRKWEIKVNSKIKNKIIKHKVSGIYTGVHFRNTAPYLNDINIFTEIIKKIGIKKVYIASDDHNAFKNFKKLLGHEYCIVQNYTAPDLQGNQIHYCNEDKNDVIMSILIDMYNLIYSKEFVGSAYSGVSDNVKLFRINDNFFN
jgi:hypothetical protein